MAIAFPTGRDSETFRDNGTEVPSLSRDKGTTGQAKNIAKGRDGPGQPNSGRDSPNPGRDAGQNGTEQKKDVLKQRDKETGKTFFPGTKGQGIFLSRDKGTSRPGLSRDVPSRGNPTINCRMEGKFTFVHRKGDRVTNFLQKRMD